MRSIETSFGPEHGGAGAKFLLILLGLILAAHAGYNYVPVAYQGANFRQEMDTAVVKGLSATGRVKPMDVVQNSIKRAMADNDVPADAVVQIAPAGGFIQAHVTYSKDVNMLPFGMYRYRYDFDYRAVPSGYLMEE